MAHRGTATLEADHSRDRHDLKVGAAILAAALVISFLALCLFMNVSPWTATLDVIARVFG